MQSLRGRLTLIILLPLLVIAVAAGVWQFRNAAERAEEIFDRGLLSAALAISRDVAVSDGDALGPATRQLISDTSGGELFYHVYAPDGVFVTGYATPPVRPAGSALPDGPFYYDANYQGNAVRVLLFRDATTVDGVTGLFNITVWQRMAVRASFVRDVVTRSFAVIALLVFSVAMVVWFGVNLGLRPLLDLEDAIRRRSPSELEPIRRPVPGEIRGLVSTLNSLLDRVSRRISSKDEFIANAAHQLRNPVAGVLALAESVEHAPDIASKRKRSRELVEAAKETSRLTNQLLSFERAAGTDMVATGSELDLQKLVATTIERFQKQTTHHTVDVSFDHPPGTTKITGDELMLQEAILNLMTNAVVHGGPDLSKIHLTLIRSSTKTTLKISDNGQGIRSDDHVMAISRFGQADAGPGSGLGLPIAARVMEAHGGSLNINHPAKGAEIQIQLPVLFEVGDLDSD
jgi:two-component system sensor histidine kinase TctE